GDAIHFTLALDDGSGGVFEGLIQFGSEGLDSKFVVLNAPRGQTGVVEDAIIVVERVPEGFEAYARVVAVNEFGLWPFYNTPYRIEMTLHDMDLGPDGSASYTRMTATTETRP